MTIHLIGLPHTEFDADKYSSCAFTSKAVRTARMLRSRGHDVITYWAGDALPGDVSVMSRERQIEFFGTWDAARLPSLQWRSDRAYWREFHDAAIAAVWERIGDGDIVAVVGGSVSQPVIDAFADRFTVIEPGVGYEGLASRTFACFESYAWMHNRYGAHGIGDGRAFDAVIPNAVDPAAWRNDIDHGYALFVGRLIARKGPHVAAQIAAAVGLPLIMAGAGVASNEPGMIVATDGTQIPGDHVTHVGAVGGKERAQLFGRASVLICPTLYIGPWEGVHAEAMMSGVGVVAPDYGVFTETLEPEYRYRSMGDAVRAVERAIETRGHQWRDHAVSLCGIERCADMYHRWIDRLVSINDGRNGWYSLS